MKTQTPKGTRDLLPFQVRRRQYITSRLVDIYVRYGLKPVETPSYEHLEVLLDKYGDEGEQLVFKILKRGASLQRGLKQDVPDLASFGLRYDLTVPLARFLANNKNDLPRQFRRYQIQKVWRADRPQKGRYCEFTQCDADIIGSDSRVSDAEILQMVEDCLSALGFEGLVLKLNHREILFGILEVCKVPESLQETAIVALDKLDKIGWDGVRKELSKGGIGLDCMDNLQTALETSSEHSLKDLETLLSDSPKGLKGVSELREVLCLVPEATSIKIDPTLARGLSYYTGMIFEVCSPEVSGSLSGGGRYNNLIGAYTKEPTPAVGFSFGLERLENLMEGLDLFPPELMKGTEILISNMGCPSYSMQLAKILRKSGFSVEVYPSKSKLGKQIKYAESQEIPCIILAGSNEESNKTVSVKDLRTRDQFEVSLGDIVDRLQEHLIGFWE